jgi:putative Mn2+ efflux pump MntP
MTFLAMLVLALALSMDAFVVSLAASASGHISSRRAAFGLSLHFGLFESHTSGEIFKQPRGNAKLSTKQ